MTIEIKTGMKRNTVMRLTDLDWKIKTMRTPIKQWASRFKDLEAKCDDLVSDKQVRIKRKKRGQGMRAYYFHLQFAITTLSNSFEKKIQDFEEENRKLNDKILKIQVFSTSNQ